MRANNPTINSISQAYEKREISESGHFFGNEKYQFFNRKGEAIGPVFEDSTTVGNLLCFCQRYRLHRPASPNEFSGCGVFDFEANDYIFKPEYEAIGYDENTELILRGGEEDLLDYDDEIDEGIEHGPGFPWAVRISDKYGVDLIDRPFAEIEILNSQIIHCVDFKGMDYLYDLQGRLMLQGDFEKIIVYSKYIVTIKGSILKRRNIDGSSPKLFLIDEDSSLSPFMDKSWTYSYRVFKLDYNSYPEWLYQSSDKRKPRYYVVKKSNKRGLMCITGKMVLPAEYDDLVFRGDSLRATINGKKYYYSVDQILEM